VVNESGAIPIPSERDVIQDPRLKLLRPLELLQRARERIDQGRLDARLAEAEPQIEGDRVQLQQVILNLIINAAEAVSAVPDGSRHSTISTGHASAAKVLVAVQDSGPGIDPVHLDRIFAAFYTNKASGLGMDGSARGIERGRSRDPLLATAVMLAPSIICLSCRSRDAVR
jgi:C4-dicarboxylate-specific signal transduction histidine kinase